MATSTRHVIGKRWWLAMPRADERVTIRQGGDAVTKFRWEWVRAAARVVIASTTPGGRFLMLRAGFPTFQTRAAVLFRELSPVRLSSDDVRQMWEYVRLWVARYEGHMQAGLEVLYQRERSKEASGVPRDDGPVTDTNPVVEAVRDGSLRRVQ